MQALYINFNFPSKMDKPQFDAKVKTKVRSELEKHMGRAPKPNEEINAQGDPALLVPILLEEVRALTTRIEDLEKLNKK